MGHNKTLLACISGQYVSLEATYPGDDIQRRLAKACQTNYSPYRGINVLKVDRNRLHALADYLGISPMYKIKVDGQPTGLEVRQYHLISCSLIIVKVDGQNVMMHGMEDGGEPWHSFCFQHALQNPLLLLQQYGVRKLEMFIGFLVVTVAGCFFVELGYAKPRSSEVFEGLFVPQLKGSSATKLAISLLGAMVMPHNLFSSILH
ncbi:hypothetical protein ACH5RR_003896 [Cinchona calisaya]|uniref:Uncharacterized protein n=1 Tax=Cinchona calisaya TaxID=153742 RepID=A0ABD3AW08_9GENT